MKMLLVVCVLCLSFGCESDIRHLENVGRQLKTEKMEREIETQNIQDQIKMDKRNRALQNGTYLEGLKNHDF